MLSLMFGPVGAASAGATITAWATFTPTTQGFGTVGTSDFEWKQIGDSLQLRGRLTAGTVAGTEGRIGFPSGFTSAASIVTIQNAGVYTQATAHTTHGGCVLIEPGVNYFTFSENTVFSNTSSGSLTKANGSAVTGTGEVISFFMEAPLSV